MIHMNPAQSDQLILTPADKRLRRNAQGCHCDDFDFPPGQDGRWLPLYQLAGDVKLVTHSRY
jgi:hypothetical protein